MDRNRTEKSWELFEGRVRKKWRRLTDEDLDAIASRRDHLEGKIHERYGFAQERIRKEVDDWSRWQTLETGPERVHAASKNNPGVRSRRLRMTTP
jgi:uncharacterized protein YjbJ (UPF0337 family)